ncbi:unnamed protein product [Allacma fusca]|uniref:Uncharacterized protein n=1 Tax=Allacma fusca TaxID=39272 RepID=A0A8J2KTI7_9HEXA|nr:unnamed protein product [Allacma fusca]
MYPQLLIGLLVLGGARGLRQTRALLEDDLYQEDSNLEVSQVPTSRKIPKGGQNSDAETDCPIEFDRKCTCTWENSRLYPNLHETRNLVVNCSNAGITNASFLEFLPTKTAKLIFTGNNVPVLEPNLFGKRDYPYLAYIDLSNNHIKEIKGKAFHHVSTVTVLRLNDNEISNESIHDHIRVFSNFFNLRALFLNDAFNDEIWSLSDLGGIFEESNLTRLEKLHLESNEIGIIRDPKLFCDLISLRELYLRNNHLPDLNIDVDCLPNLSYIDLANNYIRKIPPHYALFGLLNRVNSKGEDLRLDLSKNPFHCDCELQPFIDWVRNTTYHSPDRIHHREKLLCESGLPESNTGLLIEKLLHEVFSPYCKLQFMGSSTLPLTSRKSKQKLPTFDMQAPI